MKGLELEASIFPVDGLSLDGSISYLDFEYTSPSTGGILDGSAIPADGITPYTPEISYSFGVQYDHETEVGTFSIRFDGSYQGKLYTTAENTCWSEIPRPFPRQWTAYLDRYENDWKASLRSAEHLRQVLLPVRQRRDDLAGRRRRACPACRAPGRYLSNVSSNRNTLPSGKSVVSKLGAGSSGSAPFSLREFQHAHSWRARTNGRTAMRHCRIFEKGRSRPARLTCSGVRGFPCRA